MTDIGPDYLVGFAYNFGTLLKVSDSISLGASYHSKTKQDISVVLLTSEVIPVQTRVGIKIEPPSRSFAFFAEGWLTGSTSQEVMIGLEIPLQEEWTVRAGSKLSSGPAFGFSKHIGKLDEPFSYYIKDLYLDFAMAKEGENSIILISLADYF